MKPKRRSPSRALKPAAYPPLITGIGALLEESRRAVARAANCFMTATYWEIGRRIVEFEQGGKRRAEYGEELLVRLSRDLTERHGRGFSAPSLHRYRSFFLSFFGAGDFINTVDKIGWSGQRTRSLPNKDSPDTVGQIRRRRDFSDIV
jgi:hypothetical protein